MISISILQLAAAQSPAPQSPAVDTLQQPMFVEVQAKALPGVTTICGTKAKDYILEVNGGGVALADFDGDLAPDLVVVDGSTIERAAKGEPGNPPRLFLNDRHGNFRPAGDAWAMSGGRWGMGVAVGDVDGDGWLDLLVTQWGPNRLFLNQQGKGFKEVTSVSGLTGESWSTSAAFFDYDGDGVLDLAIVDYLDFQIGKIAPPGGTCMWKDYPVMCGPEGLTPLHDQLYRGLGGGKFKDVTLEAKFRPPAPAFGLGVMTLDYNGDGRTDLYVSNDSMPNFLWENQGDGTFKEVGFQRGVSHDANGKEQASMGIGCGDVDGDGREDLIVTNFSGENTDLYMSRKDKLFRENSFPAGIGGPSVQMLGWGTALADLDLDGDLDAFTLDGHVYPQADNPGTDTSYAQFDRLYLNDGKGHFTAHNLSDSKKRVSRASALADIDGDGDLDIVGLEMDGEVRVLQNRTRTPETKGAPHWLGVQLRSKTGNRFALGAVVTAEWEGGKRGVEIRTAGGFQSANPPEAHFGLGAATKVTKLVVRWPKGNRETFENVDVDRLMVIEEKSQ